MGFLFEYDSPAETDRDGDATGGCAGARHGRHDECTHSPHSGHVRSAHRNGTLQIGFVGAGNYASSMLLPHLAKESGVDLARVATRRSLSAVNAQRKFGFRAASTDTNALLRGSIRLTPSSSSLGTVPMPT